MVRGERRVRHGRHMSHAEHVAPAASIAGPASDPDIASRESAATPLRPARRRELRSEGASDDHIRGRRRRGELHNLRPGLYLTRDQVRESTAVDRHRALIRGFASELAKGSKLSHTSAAVLYGLPLWNVSLTRLHVSRLQHAGGHRSTWVHVHTVRSSLPTACIDGLAVTSCARTVVDCARMLPFEQGVIIADAALARRLTTRDELTDALRDMRGYAGVERARRVVGFADARSESVGESRSRVLFARLGLPRMELQHEIRNAAGLLVARVDFALPDLRIAGEFDGKVKYGRLLKAGQTPGDVVFEEKRREDAVRELHWGMVRWVWREIGAPAVVGNRWRRAISLAQGLQAG